MIAKTKDEIDALREGGRRLARHVRALAAMVRPGVTSGELEDAARAMVRADGDELAFLGHKERKGDTPYPAGLCLSINDVIVHAPASEIRRVIQEGDIVSLDFGIKHNGLYTDHAATVIAGKPAGIDDETLVRGTYEALDAGIKAAHAGGTTGDIGYAVQTVAEKYGFGYPRNLSGHGVGRSVHEEPYVPNYGEPGGGATLRENEIIAIEPMMTLGSGDLFVDKDGNSYRTKDGSRAAHAEHTVLITKRGAEILTI